MSHAVSGHGTLVAFEMGATPTPGLFTQIAEINSDVTFPPLSRNKTEVTPQEDNISSYVFDVLTAGEAKFDLNFIFSNPTHNASTGILAAISTIMPRGMRIRGPFGTAGSNEWIMSGQVSGVGRVSKNKGQDMASITFQPSGPFIIDGVLFAG